MLSARNDAVGYRIDSRTELQATQAIMNDTRPNIFVIVSHDIGRHPAGGYASSRPIRCGGHSLRSFLQHVSIMQPGARLLIHRAVSAQSRSHRYLRANV